MTNISIISIVKNSYLKKKDEEIKAHKFRHILRAMKRTVLKKGKQDTVIFTKRSLLPITL
jgi:hypothetical protein